jgi:uncharacterized protein YhaN
LPSRLQEALHGVSEELFCQVFAFSLSELAEFRQLAEETSVSEALFAAGMQGARRLPQVAHALRRTSEEIWKAGPGGRKPLNAVLQELEGVRLELEALGRPPERYFELVDLAAKLDGEVKDLDGRIAAARRQRERLERLERAAPELAALERARIELGRFGEDLEGFPADGPARIDAVEEALARCEARSGELTAGLEQTRAALAKATTASLPAPAIAELEAALQEFDRRASRREGLPILRAQIEADRSEAARKLRGLGLGVDAPELMAIDFGSAARAQLASLRARFREADREAHELQVEFRQQQTSLAELRAEVARRAAERDGLSTAPLPELRLRAAAVRRVPLLDAEWRRCSDEREDLRWKAAEISSEVDPAPPLVSKPWGVLVAAGLALVAIAGAYVWLGVTGAAGALIFSAALVGVFAAAHRFVAVARREARAGWEARKRRREEQLERISSELAEVENHQARLGSELGAAVREGGLGSAAKAEVDGAEGVVAEEIRQAERRADLERELAELTARAEERARERDLARERSSAADERLRDLRSEVERFLAARRLPPSLDVEGALALCESGAQLQEAFANLWAKEEKLRADEAAVREVAERLRAAAQASDLGTGEGGDLPAAAATSAAGSDEALALAARALVEEQQGLARTRAAEQARITQLEPQLRGAAAEHRAQRTRLNALLAAGGASDPESFRARAAKAAGRASLLQQIAVRRSAVEAAAPASVEEAARALDEQGGAEAVGGEVRRLGAEIGVLEAEHTARVEARKSARDELRALETDVRAAELRIREEELVARARELARRYARERMGLGLLSRARRTFEREQQPRVVQLASRHFAQLTVGRYPRVFLPAAEGLELRVVDARGAEQVPEKLSRGTREQLYLAFRLAVVEELREARGPLPLVLDDILVNFDPRRASAAVATLASLSERQQVIAFTCQPAIRDLFAGHDARVIELDPVELEAPLAAANH